MSPDDTVIMFDESSEEIVHSRYHPIKLIRKLGPFLAAITVLTALLIILTAYPHPWQIDAAIAGAVLLMGYLIWRETWRYLHEIIICDKKTFRVTEGKMMFWPFPLFLTGSASDTKDLDDHSLKDNRGYFQSVIGAGKLTIGEAVYEDMVFSDIEKIMELKRYRSGLPNQQIDESRIGNSLLQEQSHLLRTQNDLLSAQNESLQAILEELQRVSGGYYHITSLIENLLQALQQPHRSHDDRPGYTDEPVDAEVIEDDDSDGGRYSEYR